MRVRLSRAERQRLGKRHTVNADAYQLYLRGRYFLNIRTGEALKSARTLFERAVAEDPRYALAHAGLADCCSLIAVSLRAVSSASLIAHGRAAALTALQLDESLADGHASLAFIKFRFEWDWAGAEAEFTRALDLNPGHAPSRQWYAMFLASRARFEEALGADEAGPRARSPVAHHPERHRAHPALRRPAGRRGRRSTSTCSRPTPLSHKRTSISR